MDGETVYSYAHGVDSVEVTDPRSDILLTREGFASLTKLTWSLQMATGDPQLDDLRL